MPEVILPLLEQKAMFVTAYANACMLWWVSSVVFCSPALAGAWTRREDLTDPKNSKTLTGFGMILCVFFASIVVFGGLIIRYTHKVQVDIDKLTATFKEADGFFAAELTAFKWAMTVGTTSFILIWFAWLFLWYHLWREAQAAIPKIQRVRPVTKCHKESIFRRLRHNFGTFGRKNSLNRH